MSAAAEERTRRRATAAEALSAQSGRGDAPQVVARLDDGLTLLRKLLYTRLQADTERSFGIDSMLVPLSPSHTEQMTKAQIEAFALSEVLDEASQAGFLTTSSDWLRGWLLNLRLEGKHDRSAIAERAELYLGLEPRKRYLEFSDILERTLPEARHAPLVLYRLFPLAVRVAAALAFGNHLRAGELRGDQLALLPPIAYCRNCQGRLLEVEDTCRECGNPLWTIRWMTQAD